MPACRRRWWATTTFSSAVISLKTVVSWNVRTTPLRATACGLRPLISSPLKSTRPAVGWRNEAISLNSVLLPAPFGPMTERISPSSTSKLTSLTAISPPKRLVRSWTRTRLMASALLAAAAGAEPQAQHAVRQEHDHRDHQHAVEQGLVPLQLAEQLEGDHQEEGAHHRPEDEVQAPQEAVEHEVDRILDAVARGIDVL